MTCYKINIMFYRFFFFENKGYQTGLNKSHLQVRMQKCSSSLYTRYLNEFQ